MERWILRPYWATAAAALLALAVTWQAPGALLAAAVLPLIPAGLLALLAWRGRPIFGADKPPELAYAAVCAGALSGWILAVGYRSPYVAVGLAAALCAASAGQWMTERGWDAWATGGVALLAAAPIVALTLSVDRLLVWWIAAAIFGASAAAVPWWRRRTIRLRNAYRLRYLVDQLKDAVQQSLPMRPPVDIVQNTTNLGADGQYDVMFDLGNGTAASSAVRVVEGIEARLEVRPGAVTVQASPHKRNRIRVSVVPNDPHQQEPTRPPLPRKISQPIPLGQFDDGKGLAVQLFGPGKGDGAKSAVIGGIPGWGKSRALSTMLEGATATDDSLWWFADFSGGALAAAWEPSLDWWTTDLTEFEAMLDALQRIAEARAAELPRRRLEAWDTAYGPAIFLVVDEAQKALKNNYYLQGRVASVEAEVRKSGLGVILLTPIPNIMEGGISPGIRETSQLRMCFKSQGTAAQFLLQGTPAGMMGHVPLEFTKPGQVLVTGPEMPVMSGRTYDTPIERAAEVAEAHAARRPQLDHLSTVAAGEAYANRRGALQLVPPAEQPARELVSASASRPVGGGGVPDLSDPAVMAELRPLVDDIIRRATGESPVGWPESIQPPDDGKRLPFDQALNVLRIMLAQPQGARMQDLIRLTGYSRSWVENKLTTWHKQGAAENLDRGVWRWVTATDGDDDGEPGAGE